MFKILCTGCLLCITALSPLFSQSNSDLNESKEVKITDLKTKLEATFEEFKQKYQVLNAANLTASQKLTDDFPTGMKNELTNRSDNNTIERLRTHSSPDGADIEKEIELIGIEYGNSFEEEIEFLSSDLDKRIIEELQSIRNEFESLIDKEVGGLGEEFEDELNQEITRVKAQFDDWIEYDVKTAKEAYREQVDQEIKSLWSDFKNDLGKDIDGLSLSDMNKENVALLVSDLVDKYQNSGAYSNTFKSDEWLGTKLSELGNDKLSGELNNKISFAKIFDEYSPDIYVDKIEFNKGLQELKHLSNQKQEIFKKWNLDESSLNEYHKLLQGQINAAEFESRIKSTISGVDKYHKAKYKDLLNNIQTIEADQDKVIKQLKDNRFLKEQQMLFGDSLDLFENYDANNAFANDTFLKELNKYAKDESITDLLNNDYISDLIGQKQPKFGNVAGGVMSKDAISALESIDEEWLKNAVVNTSDIDKHKKEVEEVVLDDSHAKKLLPKNTFFEGIIGFASGDYSVFSISPNFGYKFNNGPSVGLGLTLHHTQNDSAYIRTAIDYKVFGKYEMLNDLIYLQAEYVFLVPGISYLEAETGAIEYKQTVLVGGGLSLKIKGKRILSLGIMYNLNQNMGVPAYDAPLLARLGIKLF